MSDEELLAIVAKPRGLFQPNYLAVPVLLTSAAGVAYLIASTLGGGPWWLIGVLAGLVLGWVPGMILLVSIGKVFGAGPHQNELLRRAGWRPFADWLSRAEEDVRRDDGPEWTLLFYGTALPHGGSHIVRLDLYPSRRPDGRLSFASLGYDRSHGTRDRRQDLELGSNAVSEEGVGAFLPLLASLESQPLEAGFRGPGVVDGFPFDLRVLRRSPALNLELRGNLAAQPIDPRLHWLAEALLQLSRSSGTQPALFGSTDSSGRIVIDRQ